MKVKTFYLIVENIINTIIIIASMRSIASLLNISWTESYSIVAILSGVGYIFNSQIFIKKVQLREGKYFGHLINVLKAWSYNVIILVITLFALKLSTTFSRLLLGMWFMGTPIILIFFKLSLNIFILNKKNTKGINTAVLGDIGVALKLTNGLNNLSFVKYHIRYVFNFDQIDECLELAKQSKFERLYITTPIIKSLDYVQLLNELSDSSVQIALVPDLSDFKFINFNLEKVGTVPVLQLQDSPIIGINAMLKRMVDLILSTLILILSSPLLLIIAFLIKLSSPGNILFKQTRYGLGGQRIQVWKFKSMMVSENKNIIQAKKNDPRITKIGAFIRKTSIDEFPQFFNVLSGHMSIVGPRPHAVEHNEAFRKIVPSYMRRHLIKPGITGWAQVNGWRGETDTKEKILKRTEFDLYYLENWSIWLDFKIIIMTIKSCLYDNNAH